MYAHDEFDVTGDVARELIATQFAELQHERIVFLDRGMDNAVFRAGDVVFRFPVRRVADEILRTEMAVMPRVAEQLATAVSAPRYFGKPAAGYPFAFAGFPYVEGDAASDVTIDNERRAALAAPLAAFLRALHGLDARALGVIDALPPDTIGRLDHLRRYPLVADRLQRLDRYISAEQATALMEFLQSVAPVDREGARCIVHGDLYSRHVLLDAEKRLCGIIDWGDLHFGNPAVDLAVAFYLLPSSSIDAFLEHYESIDSRTRELMIYRALYHGVLVADLGLQWDRTLVRDCGLRAVSTALEYLKARPDAR